MLRVVIAMEQASVNGFPTPLFRATVEKRASSTSAVEVLDSTMLYDTVNRAATAGWELLELCKDNRE